MRKKNKIKNFSTNSYKNFLKLNKEVTIQFKKYTEH